VPTVERAYPLGGASQPLCVQPHETLIGTAVGVVQFAMLMQSRGPQRRLRYEAGPFKRGIDRAWMVFDERGCRLVAYPLTHYEALTLAHTLNVADLRAPAVDFDDGSWGLPSR